MVRSVFDNRLDEGESAVAAATVFVMLVMVRRRCDVGVLVDVVVVILQGTILLQLWPQSMYMKLSDAGTVEVCLS